MALGSSSSSSKSFNGANQGAAADRKKRIINSRQDPNPIRSMVPSRVEQEPDAYLVIALSPTTILDSNVHTCEVCCKRFVRMQNWMLHRRCHNLPYSLRTRTPKDPVLKKVYLCPEPKCPYYDPGHALGDFSGLKKHYLRKHTDQKNHKCDNCDKAYSVQTDLRAHRKTCGKKRYICHCGARVSRGYNSTVHQENCRATQHEGAFKHSPTLYKGHGSVKTTSNYNRGNILGSTSSPPPTSELTTNDDINNLIGSNFFSIKNPSNSYQSQLGQFGTDYGSLMTNNFSMSGNPPAFFSPSPTQQNQYGFHESSDTRFYADVLTNQIPLNNMNRENMNIMGDGGNMYRTEEGSNLFSGGGFTLDHSSSLHATAVHNTGLNTGMLNSVGAYNGVNVGPSTINQNVGNSYGQFDYDGYGNRFGSGNFDYGGGMEAFNFGTSAATAEVVAPPEQNFNQCQFWF